MRIGKCYYFTVTLMLSVYLFHLNRGLYITIEINNQYASQDKYQINKKNPIEHGVNRSPPITCYSLDRAFSDFENVCATQYWCSFIRICVSFLCLQCCGFLSIGLEKRRHYQARHWSVWADALLKCHWLHFLASCQRGQWKQSCEYIWRRNVHLNIINNSPSNISQKNTQFKSYYQKYHRSWRKCLEDFLSIDEIMLKTLVLLAQQ